MSYSLDFTKRALKNLEKVSEPYYSKIKVAIYQLTDNPRPHGYKKLKGHDAFRIKVADYRIIYEIHDNIILVNVMEVGHRKDVYS